MKGKDRKMDFAQVLRDGEEQFGLPQEVLAVKFLIDAYREQKSGEHPEKGTIWTELIYPFIKPLILDFAKELDHDESKGGQTNEFTSKVSLN